MSDLPCDIRDRTVIQYEESDCSFWSKRRSKAKARRKRRVRRARKDPKAYTRQAGDPSPRLDGEANQRQNSNGSREAHSGWKSLPEERREEILRRENPSWIEFSGGGFAGQTLFQRFKEDAQTAPPRMYQVVEAVSSFCGSQTLEDLELYPDKIPSTEAYLDDRTTEGCRTDPQCRLRPLPVRLLYLELKKPRFPSCILPRAKGQDGAAIRSTSAQPASSPCRNADRRVIYLNDLNPWGAMALASTASRMEAPRVHDMIYRHLTRESHIRVRDVASNEFPFYEFEFHLPHFAWRTTTPDKKPDDAKSRGMKEPLRKVKDLSFLLRNRRSSADPSMRDYLCEAHTSVLISAIDPGRNIAYAFVDAYFNDEKKRESAKRYCGDEDSDNESDDEEDEDNPAELNLLQMDLIQMDPLSRGQFDVNLPLQDPWRYFWVCLKARTEVVEAEWKIVVGNLAARINAYIESATLDHGPFTSNVSEQNCAWIRDTKKLLRDLIDTLERLTNEWNRFQPHPAFSKDAVERERSAVEESFLELEKCADNLVRLQKKCEEFCKGVTLYMQEEAHRGSKIQARLNQISIVMLFILAPLSTSSGIYSMRPDALPHFLGPTRFSCFALALALVGVGLALTFLINFRHPALALLFALLQHQPSTKG